jgi:flagellar motor protein MotB
MALVGKGETQPMTSNASESGRQANRRVEIYVEPVVQG